MTRTLLDSFKARGFANDKLVNLAGKASRFANLGMRKARPDDLLRHESRDWGIHFHIRQRSGRRILREVIGIVDTRPTRKGL